MRFLEEANYDWMELLNFYERPFRAKLVPAKVWEDLDRYKNDSKGLSNYFRKWRTKIEFRKETSKAKKYLTYLACGGAYDPEKRQCEIHIYTNNFDGFKFTVKSWDKFKYRLIQILMHEIIHFMQFDRRDDQWSNYVVPFKKVVHQKKNEERRYLSEFDEIQAYAHCIYLDFKTFKPNYTIEQLLKRARHHTDSKTLRYFLSTFNYEYRSNVAIQKLMQQIVKWDRKYTRKTRAFRNPK